MLVEVDQSGKVEDTAVDTVVGIANKRFSYSVRLPAREKRKLQRVFRQQGIAPLFPYRVFSALIYFAIRHNRRIQEIVIDTEYTGKDDLIRLYLTRHVRRFQPKRTMPHISFASIGRSSPAHEVAINTYRGRRTPDITIHSSDIIALFLAH